MSQVTTIHAKDVKVQSVVLAYYAASQKMDIFPTMTMIRQEMSAHFLQEFSLDVRIYDRYVTLGAKDEDDFLMQLQDGRYDHHAPSPEEITIILDHLHFPFFDRYGHVHNSTIQGVW